MLAWFPAQFQDWVGELNLWLNPLYWLYLFANRWWQTLWCGLVPSTCE